MKKQITTLILLASTIINAQETPNDSIKNNIEPDQSLNEVVLTGTMKPVSRTESPVPVEVYTAKYFKTNPNPSLFESIGMINGIQPQINCNVCATGDIHINGMEGPYTMILIDGMPIVSALSTVYGLNGIPNSLVERIEVVKGPASSLYGTEAMGGLINIITKDAAKANKFHADIYTTTWLENNVDLAYKFNIGENVNSLLGVNYFKYANKQDKNNDNFTDVTLQDRVSIFNKWNFKRENNRVANIAARYVYEDRWGGEMQYNKKIHRGGDKVYGESIYTNRAEVIGMYQLPTTENIYTQFSYNYHEQDSYYGADSYHAKQHVAFWQMYWDKVIGKHSLLTGATFRYTLYDDNTPGTLNYDGTKNMPMETPLPGIFVQDEITFNPKHKLLLGYRFDYEKNHKGIHSPRVAYKFTPNKTHTFRASFGTGFRVVNLFTEDHAALTGSREVIIKNDLNPEKSYNGNLNYVYNKTFGFGNFNLDATAFYSYFTNKIIGDFETNQNQIIYDNLDGHAVSQGVSVNADIVFQIPLRVNLGVSYIDVYRKERNEEKILEKTQQLHSPKWSGNYSVSYTFPKRWMVNLTGNWYGKMRLPILENDYRPEYSDTYMLTNIQVTKSWNQFEIYGGVKNLFNFVPKDPLMRPFDPFDNNADDPVSNPNGYTFDTAYNYAPLQGIRGFIGLRYTIR
ncbi:TonB-dependent receptor plug domain-containing protein [Faecalibacter sp. LW9]|uniref:TonB-dependent receptor plug domain-containing protein n=1 Tax=Faecalibacter sp. LW9 TaxID=3103144 RepID=UPI002AFF600D|nr:TonB-dependent receptor [Faecalibacter sp. LW9]